MVEPSMSEEEVQQALREADTDGDGSVGYDEFITYMKKRAGIVDANQGDGSTGKQYTPQIVYKSEHQAAAVRIQNAQRRKHARGVAEKKRAEHRMIMGSIRDHPGMG